MRPNFIRIQKYTCIFKDDRLLLKFMLLICLGIFFSGGCRYMEPPPPTPPPDFILEDYPSAIKPDVGRLSVYTFNNDRNFTPFSGAYVQLFDSYNSYLAQVNDPKRKLFLQSIRTDSKGHAPFGDLLQGNYTIWVTYSNGSQEYSDTFTAQVVGLKSLVRNIVMK